VFDLEELVAECKLALGEPEPRLAVRELLTRTVADGDAVADVLRPTEGGLQFAYVSAELTVLHVVWAPKMRLYAHDHRMWAAIGVYTGQEDNAFYRRAADEPRHLQESGGKSLVAGDVLLLGDDAIHAVTNPRGALTGALHVYGGDFVHEPRSQWPPDGLEEPFDLDQARREFALANEAFASES
jgi:predicted metal-dependent enzyme (double-stranded beta helix superfamily)